MQQAAQPEQTQQQQLGEKEVGYHRVAPFHGGEMGALYPFCRLLNYPHDRGTRPGIAGSQREYLQWLLHVCTAGKVAPEMLLTPDAIDLLASKLRTPLQMQRHLTLALEVGYQTGEQPISAGMVDTVLSQQFDDLEPTLTRHGYHMTDLVQQFDAKPTEIKALFSNQLDPTRTAALRDRMLRAGLPL